MELLPESNEFDNVINFRDVGQTVNEFLGQKLIRHGLLFRSARLDEATARDRSLLKDDYGIKTIIDLRTSTEHINAAKKRAADFQALRGLARTKALALLHDTVQIPGLCYREIKLTGRRFELFLLSQLRWLSCIKFLVLFLVGLRMRAIAIIGSEVINPRGLVGLGLDTLEYSKYEIAQTLNSFLTPVGLPALVHCTQGKDRTGIIIILVLLILGVPVDAIEHDYRLSDAALMVEQEGRLAEIREIGLTDDWGRTSPMLVQRTAEHLIVRYGGIDRYLDTIGFGVGSREALRCLLLY